MLSGQDLFSTMNKIIIGALIAIVLLTGTFFTGLYFGKTYFPQKIKVKEVKVENTIWKDKYDQLQKKIASMPKQITPADKEKITDNNLSDLIFCYNASLDFKDHVENNTLFVTAYTPCKEATAKYEIGTKGDYKIYLTVGVIGILAGTGLTYYLTKK